VSRHFGGIRALEDISFSLRKGSITSLIGPKGRENDRYHVVTGISLSDAGVSFPGEACGLPAHTIASRG